LGTVNLYIAKTMPNDIFSGSVFLIYGIGGEEGGWFFCLSIVMKALRAIIHHS
jgi:hypothetical protein